MPIRVSHLLLLGTTFVTISGCMIVPYKTKPLTETFGGATVNRELFSAGTPRASILQSFRTAVIASGPRLIIVRVRYSDSGVFAAFGGIANQPGAAGGVAQSDRNWHTQNLFIEFDEADRLRQHRIVTDSALLPELENLLAQGLLDAPQFTEPIFVSMLHGFGRGRTGILSLSLDGITWEDDRKSKMHFAKNALSLLRHSKRCTPRTDNPARMNEELCISINLRSPVNSLHMNARVSAIDFFRLVAFRLTLQQDAAGDHPFSTQK